MITFLNLPSCLCRLHTSQDHCIIMHLAPVLRPLGVRPLKAFDKIQFKKQGIVRSPLDIYHMYESNNNNDHESGPPTSSPTNDCPTSATITDPTSIDHRSGPPTSSPTNDSSCGCKSSILSIIRPSLASSDLLVGTLTISAIPNSSTVTIYFEIVYQNRGDDKEWGFDLKKLKQIIESWSTNGWRNNTLKN
ncbi:hypothetical protein L2E82_31517 [Cichorium intybus]|uniref:Uncharacterized protein n=1 Tax=Cichorium intybus TaxID=13427 RepID=A0ACB9BEA2_CICIN|nr:hypothetical protein L2E82_31517 [Cichorium intybus]